MENKEYCLPTSFFNHFPFTSIHLLFSAILGRLDMDLSWLLYSPSKIGQKKAELAQICIKDVELVCMHILMHGALSRMAVLLAVLRLNVINIKIDLLFPAEKCHSISVKMSWNLQLHYVITTSV